MFFYNILFNVFIAYFYVKNNLCFGKNLKVKALLIIIILINSFNLIFVSSNENLYEAFIFYFNQENIIEYINPKEIFFFSKIALINILFIIMLILIFSFLKKISNIIFIKNINLKFLIVFVILFNPLTIQQFLKFSDTNGKKLEILKNEIRFLQNYNYDNLIKKKNKKNLVFLIVESLNYDIANNKELMPNLSRIAENGQSFTNINELNITNYTTSGIYALLCGNFLPIYNISKEQKCLTHILNDNDYDVMLIRGDSNSILDDQNNGIIDFGKDKINICDQECLLKKYDLDNFHVWGAHDNILFNEAIEVIEKKNKEKNNYAIFLKTIDSHIEGYLSNKCIIDKVFELKIEKVFYCLDKEINKLVDKIKLLDVNNETIIVITSDHLMMNQPFIEKKISKKKQKNFFLILDQVNQNLKKNNKSASKIDIPATVSHYMGLGENIGIGISINSNKTNLYNKINDINEIKLIKDNSSFNLREFIKKNLRSYLSNNSYSKIKKMFKKLRQKVAIYKYKYIHNFNIDKKIDPTNFNLIAHAGGEIDSFNYTNSLESINLSYKNGFKFIELDILETSDGHFVASHDWKYWSEITKYEEKLPPSLKDFKQYKIHGKYTPLTIYDIKKWFKERPDATLITDKINTPDKFFKIYELKDQLIMELFDEESIRLANNLGVQFLISDIFLYKNLPLNRELLEKLILLRQNFRGIAASNDIISKHLNFFVEAFEDFSIDIYFYQLSEKKKLKYDQINFLCNFSNLLKGGYIEYIDFNKKINCNN